MSKTLVVPVRIDPADRKKIEKAAKHDHLPISTWIRVAALKAAEKARNSDE